MCGQQYQMQGLILESLLILGYPNDLSRGQHSNTNNVCSALIQLVIKVMCILCEDCQDVKISFIEMKIIGSQ